LTNYTTEFQSILKLNVYKYDGKMLSIKNKYGDFLWTPNHRILWKHRARSSEFFRISSAENLPSPDIYIPSAFPSSLDRADYLIPDDIIRVIAWIITEGSIKGNGYDISQNEKKNKVNCKLLDDIWNRLGWSIQTNKNTVHFIRNGERIWHVPAKEAKKLLRLDSNDHKVIPIWMLEKFSMRQLEILFDILVAGDGRRTKTWGKFSSADFVCSERFQILTTLLGYRSILREDKSIYRDEPKVDYRVSFNFHRHYSTLKQKHKKQVDYSGIVWCPTVDNGFWVARRNGCVCITGNSMGVMDVDHPEILDFIKEKLTPGSMNNFNLSVMVNNEFMIGVEEDDKIFLRSRIDKRVIKGKFNCRDLFNIITYSAWLTGDPGLLFFDRINKDNPYYPKYPIRATNPCGEVPLLPYESCCLGSINLSNFVTKDGEFDVVRFSDMVRIGTKMLMAMTKICEFPIDECYVAQSKYMRLGLGVMGFADMLMKMGILYDSDDSLKMIDTIGTIMKESKQYAPMSVATLSIAPTGSLSILADCSSGIEPWFAKSYTRHLTHGKVKEKRESKYLRTAHQIEPEWHLKVQARWQHYIDNGVSKTINLPYDATIEDVKNIYMDAWKMDCKGITIFRDGCLGAEGQVLRSTCDDESCYL